MKKILLLLGIPFLNFGQSIGDFYQGGIIFYIENSGKGLVVDTAYLEASYPWSGLDKNGNVLDSMVSDWGPYLHYCVGTENENMGMNRECLVLHCRKKYALNSFPEEKN